MRNDTIGRLGLYVLDILFPNRCPFCGGFIMWDELCCRGCLDALEPANDSICHRCGQDKCRCDKSRYAFDAVYGSLFFDETRDAVYLLKNSGELNFAKLAAGDFADRISGDSVLAPDIIVPVPMGKRKQRKRGHNQAELFGKCISKRLDIPVKRDILFKYDEKDEQHFHNAKEREDRVKMLFRGGNADLSGKNVLLCDDVMTTGSTLNECAAILKDMGAEKVIAVVCAVTRFK